MIASIVAIVLYTAGFFVRWRAPETEQRLPILLITLSALAAHGLFTADLLLVPGGINLSLISVCNVVAVALVLVLATANLRLEIANLYLFLFPIAVLVLAAALIVEPTQTPITNLTGAQVAHILISLAAYSALMMAACQSLLVAAQEHRLRTPGRPVMRLLPPLETMERLLIDMLWIGFVLLSGAILSGYLFFDDIFSRQVMHHIVLTSLSWLIYVVFLGGRYLFGWRGLTAVRWTLVAFSLLLLGYLGSKFVMEFLLHR